MIESFHKGLTKMLEIDEPVNREFGFESEITVFEKNNNVVMPGDIKEYFRLLGDANMQYNEILYRFHPLKEFKSIHQELKNFNGVPDYSNIVSTLSEYKSYFIFADYMFHMYSYAIRLYERGNQKNEILIILGDEYKIIGNSFADFVYLYNTESGKLQFED